MCNQSGCDLINAGATRREIAWLKSGRLPGKVFPSGVNSGSDLGSDSRTDLGSDASANSCITSQDEK